MIKIIQRIINENEFLKGARINKELSDCSQDMKVLLETEDEAKFCVQIFKSEDYQRKNCQFNLMRTLCKKKLPLSEPLRINDIGEVSYIIYHYLDGVDGEVYMRQVGESEQYRLGFIAGETLKKFHSQEGPNTLECWFTHKKSKHQRYMKKYHQCKGNLENDEKIINFINHNIDLMIDRPTRFQHDDYHLGNMIFKDGKLKGIIDFDLFDWGDPIHDFVKIGFFSRDISIPFCIGQIHGYFNGEPDEKFWKLYSLYHAMAAITVLPWIEKFPEQDHTVLLKRVNTFLEDQDYFSKQKPFWYDLHSRRLRKINSI